MKVLHLIAAAALTLIVDHLLSHVFPATPGLVRADPITIIAVSAAVTATAAVAGGVANYSAQQRAADKARSLKNEQASSIKAQQDAAAALAAKQAATGASFGYAPNASAFATGFGFTDKKGAPNTGFGRTQLTGGA